MSSTTALSLFSKSDAMGRAGPALMNDSPMQAKINSTFQKFFLARYFITTVRKATDTVGSSMMKRLSCLVLLGVLFGS